MDRLLHLGIEILQTHRHAGESRLAQSNQVLARGHAGIGLDRNLVVEGLDRETRLHVVHELGQLFRGEVGGSAPSQVHLNHFPLLAEALHHQVELLLEPIQIGLGDFLASADHHVAPAEEAALLAEGDVEVEGERPILALLEGIFQLGETQLEIPRAPLVRPHRRRGVGGIAGPRPVILAQQFFDLFGGDASPGYGFGHCSAPGPIQGPGVGEFEPIPRKVALSPLIDRVILLGRSRVNREITDKTGVLPGVQGILAIHEEIHPG